jgi:hypothetical protein
MNTWLAENVVKLVNALMDGWRDRSTKESKLDAVDFYFYLRVVERMSILPGYIRKNSFFIKCLADQSTFLDFKWYEDKGQHIEIKKNNKSLKHVQEIWTVLLA